ncbi:pyruvate dehydrogenase (acetyl-transferring) E1 component subunit alpha [Streptomyces griseoviridis]|uniref:Pyruvate dehydrogenase (Acetyl-transferring) E1 component subunit alpha n=1 Tax=Streptomyces griseoviridis TaxID=45398 RepID=A0A3Q9KXX4_STRGD|nr:pyruvate dehydrogenase (acetyl-transferring) E1 component subunit alpha [Streptomyces griseoviridis]AZS89609.1 pyruvate dehydrogenase (acetyl-transferring) E1 component subunit alpha [Streptomyces griseoviridis]QCN83553.1 pyruvate dehydrogenase (acetyl-transferring) E1 component subunit alpha [Streptomyces griseoviridis]
MSATLPPQTVQAMLPAPAPVCFVTESGKAAEAPADYPAPSDELLREAYRRMVVGRRYDEQATALAKQGRLAVYPSSRGQEACQIGAALALREHDWLVPTYRDSVAVHARGVDPVQVLTLLRGDWHCGYDPAATRVAPQCTPLATQLLHATGMADGMRRKGEDGVVLALVGDGGTSEGDFHEALNFAAVFRAPVVFLVQNNQYAISVPLARQTAAPALAYKGIGYGVHAEQVDGNDVMAVLAVMTAAVDHARRGDGPVLVEAQTYRVEPHTDSDDPSRYRDEEETLRWAAADPVRRLETYLRDREVLTERDVETAQAEGEAVAADVRGRIDLDQTPDPLALFDHVYAEPTPQLLEQRDQLAAEMKERED